MRPIYTLEDLGAAATDAAALVRAGEVSRAQAADDLQDMAVATGLLERYGADAVQHSISDRFARPMALRLSRAIASSLPVRPKMSCVRPRSDNYQPRPALARLISTGSSKWTSRPGQRC